MNIMLYSHLFYQNATIGLPMPAIMLQSSQNSKVLSHDCHGGKAHVHGDINSFSQRPESVFI